MNYREFKEKYENTKPIRGRSEDVRPLGKRSRTHEVIRANTQPDGSVSYACRLYRTDCVEYFANGDVVLRTGGHVGPTTAAFLHRYSPYSVMRAYGHIWAMSGTLPTCHIVPSKGGLRVERPGSGPHKVHSLPMYRKVVNRTKAREARSPFMPFLSWAKSFLSMSDGWIMYETRREVMGADGRYENAGEHNANLRPKYTYPLAHGLGCAASAEQLYTLTRSEDGYLEALCNLLNRERAAETRPSAYSSNPYPYFSHYLDDCKFEFPTLKRWVYRIVERGLPVHDLVEIPAGTSPLRNIEPQ